MFEPGSSSDTNKKQRDSQSSIVRSGGGQGSDDVSLAWVKALLA
ncbi:hypothetical protein ACQV2C_03665 [Pantoea allii]|nr:MULTISPECIES: hypothetical protein [Pantoea]MDJ0039990.1 hypothetical protein [Pantoea allii]MDJ0088136.1 hypothetical protein [Pantoea allii]